MTEEVWANTDAKPCVCFLACGEGLNESCRQVSAQHSEARFLHLCFHDLRSLFLSVCLCTESYIELEGCNKDKG